jgi:hypothetical protein
VAVAGHDLRRFGQDGIQRGLHPPVHQDPNITSTSATGNTVTGKYKVSGDVLAASMQYKF